MRKRTLKRRILRSLNGPNCAMIILSIVVSLSITAACGAMQENELKKAKSDNIIVAVNRVADAFDWYNERRF